MLVVRELYKTYGAVAAVRGVSLSVEQGQTFTLLGPSGCGKTTTLRCIAGLERPDSGEIELDRRVVDSPACGVHVAPYDRPIGMVFQSYAIWPHMSVFENVAYPLRTERPRLGKRRIEERVMEALRLVKMEALAKRPAPQLSGGQQQRVALARALVSNPKLLLLDEPLSNLDAKLREQMRHELSALVATLGMATLYVTHDQSEALAMSQRIAVMDRGVVVQEGTPEEVYSRPRHPFVADFVGTANLFEGTIAVLAADGMVVVETRGAKLACGWPGRAESVTPGARVTVVVRPEDVEISREALGADANVSPATVEDVTYLGNALECRATAAWGPLCVQTHPAQRLRRDERVFVRIPPEACRILQSFPGSSPE